MTTLSIYEKNFYELVLEEFQDTVERTDYC
jgi:hypothetical protein